MSLVGDATIASLVTCYFNSNHKLVAELAYGYDILDGVQYYDAFGRKIDIVSSGLSLQCRFLNTKQKSHFLVQIVGCASNSRKLKYVITHNNANLNDYSNHSSPMLVIPLTNDYVNKPETVTFTMAIDTGKSIQVDSSSSYPTDGVLRYANYIGTTSPYRCIANQCYFQTFVNETSQSVDAFTITNKIDGVTLKNYQFIKLDKNYATLPSSGIGYSVTASDGYSINNNQINFGFVKDCYYISGGERGHHNTQSLTISVQSSDLERCPLYCLTYRFDFKSSTSNTKTYLPSELSNGPKSIDIDLIGASFGYFYTVTTTLNIGIYPLLMRQEYFPTYQTTGQQIVLKSIINTARVTSSQIVCKILYESTEYAYTPDSIQVQNYKTYSVILVTTTVGNPGTTSPYRVRVNYMGDTMHYNDFPIHPQSKPNLLGICKVSTGESTPMAHNTMFGIYCEDYSTLDFRSLKIQVLNDQSQSLMTLSNTKQTRIFARLPKSATGKSNTVLFTFTDSNGAVFEFKDTYTASMWSDTNLIRMVEYYIKTKQVRTYQTANNYAILLDILADYCKRNSLSASELVTVKGILTQAINETINIRDVVFLSNTYPEATELLFALFRESANLAYLLGFSEFNNQLNQIFTFMTNYGRKSSFSNIHDYTFLNNFIARMEASQSATDSSSISSLKNIVNSLTKIASMNSQFKNDYFTYQSLPYYLSDEISSNEVALENRWVRVLFGSEVAGLVSSQSQFNVVASLYKKSIVDGNVTIPIIASIDLQKQDTSTLNITGLQTPVTIFFNLDLINSTLSHQYQTYQSRISCYYLNELTNKWANDGMTTEITYESGQLVVKCSSTHLTSFTIFSDLFNTTTDSSTSNIRSSGLTPGEKAAIGVTLSLFFLIVIIVIVIIIIVVIYYQVKKGKSSKSVTKSMEETNPITKSYLELTPVANSDSGPSLFISEYKSVREPASTNQSTTSTSYSTSEPTSSLMTSTGGNAVIGKKYEILEKIGQGAFGAVFRSKNLSYTGRTGEHQFVAIKKIQLSGLSEMNDKFKEAVNMFKIRNENLVCLEDAVVDESTMSLYLVMQFYSQGDLDKFIKSKKLLTEQVLKQIVEQVCQGLKYLEEEKNMLHRDIKPSNIFIESFDEKKIKTVVSDFGLAKENNMMSSISFAGTPYFMSPQALIGAKYSFNADIFSLGCTIFLLITHDMSQSIAQLYFQHQGNLGEVHSFITNSIQNQVGSNKSISYSPDFIQLLLQMMEFDPNKRPNASGVLKLLKNLP